MLLVQFRLHLFIFAVKDQGDEESGAGVAELVDALDLGSSGFMPWGFKSLRPHQEKLWTKNNLTY